MLSKERLDELKSLCDEGFPERWPCEDMLALLSHIHEQEEVIAQLTEALKPFGAVGWLMEGRNPDDVVCTERRAYINVGHFRRANAVVCATETPQPQEEKGTPTSSKGEST